MYCRPHNSGHYTMDACVTEQHEMHLRAVAGLPLGDTSLKVGAAGMSELYIYNVCVCVCVCIYM